MMASAIGLRLNMQEEDVLERTNAKCIYVHFNQLVYHFVI